MFSYFFPQVVYSSTSRSIFLARGAVLLHPLGDPVDLGVESLELCVERCDALVERSELALSRGEGEGGAGAVVGSVAEGLELALDVVAAPAEAFVELNFEAVLVAFELRRYV